MKGRKKMSPENRINQILWRFVCLVFILCALVMSAILCINK